MGVYNKDNSLRFPFSPLSVVVNKYVQFYKKKKKKYLKVITILDFIYEISHIHLAERQSKSLAFQNQSACFQL